MADTSREAVPQFDCPTRADTGSPHPGQVERMNDARVAFRKVPTT